MAINETYKEFVEKFKPKKTTDDCYTPTPIYNIVADYVANKYKLNKKSFVRPFYPGGDFENYLYHNDDDVVVDNPPFSILSKIIDFYMKNNIKFFLFCQSNTAISTIFNRNISLIYCNSRITYENGAKVNTSFITNLEKTPKIKVDNELYFNFKKYYEKEKKAKEKPRIKYPDNLFYFGGLSKILGTLDFEIPLKECKFIKNIGVNKYNIFGAGVLISNEKAEELKALEELKELKELKENVIEIELTKEEKETINNLGG